MMAMRIVFTVTVIVIYFLRSPLPIVEVVPHMYSTRTVWFDNSESYESTTDTCDTGILEISSLLPQHATQPSTRRQDGAGVNGRRRHDEMNANADGDPSQEPRGVEMTRVQTSASATTAAAAAASGLTVAAEGALSESSAANSRHMAIIRNTDNSFSVAFSSGERSMSSGR